MMRCTLSLAALMIACVALTAGVGMIAPARAYEFYVTRDTGQPLRWWQRDVLEYRISTVAPEEGSSDAIAGLVATAFDAWIDAPCGRAPEVTLAGPSIAPRATTPSSLRAEPDNVLVFIRSVSEWVRFKNSPTWIAITKIAHDPKTGEIVDADIEINDGGYVFSYDDTPAAGEVDFVAMLTHEVGHFYGLDHSAESAATMFATYATSPERAMDARTLARDDMDGVCSLYTDVPVHVVHDPDTGICGAGGSGLGAWGGVALLALGLRRRRCRS